MLVDLQYALYGPPSHHCCLTMPVVPDRSSGKCRLYVNNVLLAGKREGEGRARSIKAAHFKQGTKEDRDLPP
jgi:hypothetical protein